MGPWSRLWYAPFLAQLVVTRKCNLSCGYCNEFDDHSPPVPRELLEHRIDKLKALGTWALELTGGEPLEHPDLVELVRYAAAKKFLRVELISNGYLWGEKMVHALNDAGLTHLQISVDGVETNDVTIKVLRPLRKKLETIARLAKFKVTLSAVIGSAPAGEALEVVAFAQEHGLRPRILLLHGPDGRLKLSTEQLSEYREVQRIIGARSRESHDYRTRLIETGNAPFKCRAGSRYLYVDEFGMVRWCSQTRDSFGKALDDYTVDDLVRQFYTRKDCNDTCTVGCVRSCSSPEEWRGQPIADPGPPAADLVQLRSESPERREAS